MKMPVPPAEPSMDALGPAPPSDSGGGGGGEEGGS